MLNLRIGMDEASQHSGQHRSTIVRDNLTGPQVPSPKRTFEETIMGNLGGEVSFWGEEDTTEYDERDHHSHGETFELSERSPYPASESVHSGYNGGYWESERYAI